MKFYFQASHAEVAQEAFQVLSKRYGQQLSPAEADVIVPIGGDGEALKALQLAIEFKKPVYGINLGHVGFLQNIYRKNKNLEKSIRAAEATELSPLRVEAYLLDGSVKKAFAVNEVQICNHNRASIINLHVDINEKEHIKKLGGDGLIISTTVGSTGYNKAAGGTMLPLGDDIIALTPNNPFNPPLKSETIRPGHILVKVLDPTFRAADVVADYFEVGLGAEKIIVDLDTDNKYKILFDPGYSWHERNIRAQNLAYQYS